MASTASYPFFVGGDFDDFDWVEAIEEINNAYRAANFRDDDDIDDDAERVQVNPETVKTSVYPGEMVVFPTDKYFAAGGVPQMLQNPLIHLHSLFLCVCFASQDELSSILCLIRSSPKLAIICLKMYGRKLRVKQSSIDFHNLSSFDLDNLKELRILKFCNFLPEMEFVKLIMANSRVLEKARLELDAKVSADDELTMLRDLVRVPFPRASPTAKLIIERPKSSS